MTKCWYVYHKDQDDEYGEFEWRETLGQAKYNASFVGEVDWKDIRAKRVPALDDKPFADDEDVWKAGFFVSCMGCRKTCTEPVFQDGFAFCDEVCRSKMVAKWNKERNT